MGLSVTRGGSNGVEGKQRKAAVSRGFLLLCVSMATEHCCKPCLFIDRCVLQDSGECDELRLISNSPRSRVLGIGGDIVIQDTEVLLATD